MPVPLLLERGLFAAVSRELGERRPDFLLAGDLHAIEVEQNTTTWQAHIAFTLQVSDAETDDILWANNFDERQPCVSHSYAEAVEALSAALDRALNAALNSFAQASASGQTHPMGGPPAPCPTAVPGATPVPIGKPPVPGKAH